MVKKSLTKIFIIISFLSITLVVGCNETSTQESDFAEINSAILDEIEVLTSEEYEGRMAGSEGNRLATEYIAKHFKQIGLKSPEGLQDYLQFYNQYTLSVNSKPTLSILDKENNITREFEYIDEFTIFISRESRISGDVIAEPLIINGLNKLKGFKEGLKGKVLLFPKEVSGKSNTYYLAKLALETGAKGVIFENPYYYEENYGDNLLAPAYLGGYAEDNINGYFPLRVTSEIFEELEMVVEQDRKLKISMDNTVESKKVANVIGVIPGTDDQLKDESIIISAHFDHIGNNQDGTYNPGALDNASGTAVMMEVAEILAMKEEKPKKTLIFIGFNGEEEGLFGSNYYVRNPVVPLDKAVVINLDMVGSKEKLPLKIVSYNKQTTDLRDELYNFAKGLNIDSEKGVAGYSDHASFSFMNIDAVTLINEDFKVIHNPEDNIDVISGERIAEIAKLIIFYLEDKAY